MNTELTAYYKDLLIMQYRDKPKALGHVGAVLDAGMIYDIAIAVRDGFNIETAIGKQLDILGKILGVSRTITGTTFTRAYYGYALYGDTTPFLFNPMLLYGAEPPDVQFRDYRESSQSLYDLTDEEYRIILKLAVVRNTSNASVKTIDEILNVLFGAECYFIDRMNMTVVSYMVGDKWARIFQIAKASGLLPNPAGVGTSLVVVPDINNIFAYSLYGGEAPEFAVGYGRYPFWSEYGDEIILFGYPQPIAKLSETKFVASSYDGPLKAWYYDGVSWNVLGNTFDTEDENSNIVGLSETRIAHVSGTGVLQAYDFDGTDFIAVGNPLSIASSFVHMTSLSSSIISTLIAGVVQNYSFDGTDWSTQGNPMSTSYDRITSVSSSRVVLGEATSPCAIRAYDFNGTDWSATGNSLSISTAGIDSMSGLSSSKVVLQLNNPDGLKTYSFDETDWTEDAESIDTPDSFFSPWVTALSETTVIRSFTGAAQEYRLLSDLPGCMASYS